MAPVTRFAGAPVRLQQLVGGLHWTPGATFSAYVPAIGPGFVAGTSKILTKDGGIVLR